MTTVTQMTTEAGNHLANAVEADVFLDSSTRLDPAWLWFGASCSAGAVHQICAAVAGALGVPISFSRWIARRGTLVDIPGHRNLD